MSLTPRGMQIQEAYRLYHEKKLFVNRRYQRKLVWSEEEKRRLIDSIERGYPLPLFLFSGTGDESDGYEIIDGLQRLNAIFSFIEHQFLDYENNCFNMAESSRVRDSVDQGLILAYDDDIPRMPKYKAASFFEYQLAVTIDTERDDMRINDVFGRINSGGRQLSPQEQRQAGLVSPLSDLVRMIASEIRGDSSPDLVTLSEMPAISINTPKERQRYGVDASDVFWCRHGIISAGELSKGLDEQIVSDLCLSLLLDEPLAASRETFDEFYDPDTDSFKDAQARLYTYGQERLKSEIITVISEIRRCFETGSFEVFRNCVQRKPRNTAWTSFFATFMSFHEQIFTQGKIANDVNGIRKALQNLQQRMIRSAHYTKAADRRTNINLTNGLIQGQFIKGDVAALGGGHGLTVDLENSLRRSRYESNRYEFKIGITRLTTPPQIDEGMIAKIARTACAIANIGPNTPGYIYLGVADEVSAAER